MCLCQFSKHKHLLTCLYKLCVIKVIIDSILPVSISISFTCMLIEFKIDAFWICISVLNLEGITRSKWQNSVKPPFNLRHISKAVDVDLGVIFINDWCNAPFLIESFEGPIIKQIGLQNSFKQEFYVTWQF